MIEVVAAVSFVVYVFMVILCLAMGAEFKRERSFWFLLASINGFWVLLFGTIAFHAIYGAS
jgi:hypothetical protein